MPQRTNWLENDVSNKKESHHMSWKLTYTNINKWKFTVIFNCGVTFLKLLVKRCVTFSPAWTWSCIRYSSNYSSWRGMEWDVFKSQYSKLQDKRWIYTLVTCATQKFVSGRKIPSLYSIFKEWKERRNDLSSSRESILDAHPLPFFVIITLDCLLF